MSTLEGATRERILVAIRQDLARVARMTDAPEGFAPSLRSYEEHGRYGWWRVRSAVGGTKDGNPVLQWSDAVRGLGFTPYEEWDSGTYRMVVADLRRVALECGDPRVMPTQAQYKKHGGHWSRATVLARLDVSSWNEAADLLGLVPQRVLREAS